MAVGAVVGLTLGPKSPLLPQDTYVITDLGAFEFRQDPEDPGSKVTVPQGLSARLDILEIRRAARKDVLGAEFSLPRAVRVNVVLPDEAAFLGTGEVEAIRQFDDGDNLWLMVQTKPLLGGGFSVVPEPRSRIGDQIVSWLRPIGTLFMRLIKMVIIPLVFASLLVGVAGLGDVRKLGRLGGKTLGLYLATTATAVTIGLTVAHLISPGMFVSESDRIALMTQFESSAGAKVIAASKAPSTIDNILMIVPENPIASMAQGDMLSLMFFAIIFGIALTLVRGDGSTLVVRFFDTVQQAMIVVIHIVMAVAPFGVAALIADVVGNSGLSILKALVVYSAAVVLGLAILAGGLYAGLVMVFAKIGWVSFMRAGRPAQMIAFSTSSSSAALPVTLECAEQNLGVSNSVSSFVVPLGSTVNMDGTALYQGVAAVFIAQVFNIDLSFGTQVAMVLAATMASIGAAGVPGAGMITLAMVLITAGVPPVGVALILGVDRILDMFRSAVNVTGDLAVTAVVAASEGERLQILTPKQDVEHHNRGFEGRLDRESRPIAAESEDA